MFPIPVFGLVVLSGMGSLGQSRAIVNEEVSPGGRSVSYLESPLEMARVYSLRHHHGLSMMVFDSRGTDLPEWAVLTKARTLLSLGRFAEARELLDWLHTQTTDDLIRTDVDEWSHYLHTVTGASCESLEAALSRTGYRPISDLENEYWYLGPEYVKAEKLLRPGIEIRIHEAVRGQVEPLDIAEVARGGLWFLYSLGACLPSATPEIYVRPCNVLPAYYALDLIHYCPEKAREFEDDEVKRLRPIVFELGHWYAGGDDIGMDRMASECYACYVLAWYLRGASTLEMTADEVKDRLQDEGDLTRSFPSWSESGGFDGDVLAAFAFFILEKVGEKGFWDIYYDRGSPFQRVFGKPLKALVEDDFTPWVRAWNPPKEPRLSAAEFRKRLEDEGRKIALFGWPPGLPKTRAELEKVLVGFAQTEKVRTGETGLSQDK